MIITICFLLGAATIAWLAAVDTDGPGPGELTPDARPARLSDPPLCELCGIGGGLHDYDCPAGPLRLERKGQQAWLHDDQAALDAAEDRYLNGLLGEPGPYVEVPVYEPLDSLRARP